MHAVPSPGLIRKVGQIHVNAYDVERAVAFYRDRLGLKFLFQVPAMAFFQVGELTLMLGIASDKEYDHPSSILYLDVADIGEAHRIMAQRGVDSAPSHTWSIASPRASCGWRISGTVRGIRWR